MAIGPEAFFDVTKLLKEFDPTKAVGEFSNILKQYKLPGVDVDAIVASQKKNLEALTSANRVAIEGLQAVAKRQAEILQETMNEASKAVDSLSKAGSPPRPWARAVPGSLSAGTSRKTGPAPERTRSGRAGVRCRVAGWGRAPAAELQRAA